MGFLPVPEEYIVQKLCNFFSPSKLVFSTNTVIHTEHFNCRRKISMKM